MKKLMLTAVMATCAAFELSAMPTKEETAKAEPLVRNLLASERAAFKKGKKTRAEVAAAALKLAGEADTEAAKLLLMKGAFVLYVNDGNLEKAVETINALEKEITDLPPQSITNMVELALIGVSTKEDGARLQRLLDESKNGAKVEGSAAAANGVKWNYEVKDDGVVIGGNGKTAVPTTRAGALVIPTIIDRMPVRGIGPRAFAGCNMITSVTISASVTSIGAYAFSGCERLKSVNIPASVTSIGIDAFRGCGRIQTVRIPSNVKTIEGHAFAVCKELACVTMLGERPKAPDNVFHECGKLKEIHVPMDAKSWSGMKEWQGIPLVFDGKETVNGYAWSYWLKDGEATIAGKTMGYYCSVSPTPTGHMVIPSTLGGAKVTSVGVAAFYWCDGMVSVTIPESVTNIEHGAFQRCSGLKSVTIPSGVRNIAKQGFWACEGLETVTMLGERPEVGFNTFEGCGKLKAIHVPANAKSWAGMKEWQGIPLVFDGVGTEGVRVENATEKTRKAVAKLFPGWSLDTEVEENKVAGLHASHRGQSDVVCVHPKDRYTPAIVGRTVTLSDKNPCLFLKVASWKEDADYLLSVRVNGNVVMPNRLICTPDCEPWQDIVLPLTEWRGRTAKIEVVFAANSWLSYWPENPMLARLEIAEGNGDMRIIEGKATIDGYTWSYRAQNGEATIVSEKGGGFSCAVSPSPKGRVVIPAALGGAKVTRIGRNALRGCKELTAATIPEGVRIVGRDSFADCDKLAMVTLSSNVEHLDWGAFGNCVSLGSVALPSGVKSIGRWAFRYCNAIKTVSLPASVTNIHGCAFCESGTLMSFRVAEDNPVYKSENGLLLTKDGTALVHGVNGTVTIPSTVTNIQWCAFEGFRALEPVVIPSNVKTIGDYAFKNCYGLTSVTMLGERPNIGSDVFKGCCNLKAIHVPANAKSWTGMKTWQGIPLVFDAKT